MQIIDALLLIPLVLGAYIGFQKGLFAMAGKLLSVMAAFVGSIVGLHFIEKFLLHFFPALQNSSKAIAFGSTFLVTLAISYLFVYFLSHIGFQKVKLEGMDNALGAVVGAFRFGFWILIVVFLLAALDKQDFIISKEQKEKSVLYQSFQKINQFSLHFLIDHPNMQALKTQVEGWYNAKA